MLKIVSRIKKNILYSPSSSLILLFHHLSLNPEIDRSGCKLDTDSFIKILSKYKNYISLQELLSEQKHKCITITFDDGLADVYNIGYKYLKKWNIPFTIFVSTDLLDTEGYITKEQLIEMANDNLVTIGAHGVTHRVLTSLDSEGKRFEITQSRRILEQIIGKKVNIFAYSHGQYDDECIRLVKEAGYSYAVSVEAYPYNIFTRGRRYRIPRVNVDFMSLKSAESILERIF